MGASLKRGGRLRSQGRMLMILVDRINESFRAARAPMGEGPRAPLAPKTE